MYRRIRDLREDRDLRQKDLAEVLHCTQVCYSHYEIGTSTDYLLGLTDEPTPYPRAREKQDP